MLGYDQERSALSPPASARWFCLRTFASSTPTAAVRIGQTVDDGNGLSLVGNRTAHASGKSVGRVRECGHRPLCSRPRADHMDGP